MRDARWRSRRPIDRHVGFVEYRPPVAVRHFLNLPCRRRAWLGQNAPDLGRRSVAKHVMMFFAQCFQKGRFVRRQHDDQIGFAAGLCHFKPDACCDGADAFGDGRALGVGHPEGGGAYGRFEPRDLTARRRLGQRPDEVFDLLFGIPLSDDDDRGIALRSGRRGEKSDGERREAHESLLRRRCRRRRRGPPADNGQKPLRPSPALRQGAGAWRRADGRLGTIAPDGSPSAR